MDVPAKQNPPHSAQPAGIARPSRSRRARHSQELHGGHDRDCEWLAAYCQRPALLEQDRLNSEARRAAAAAAAVAQLGEAVTEAGVTIAAGFPDGSARVSVRGEILALPDGWERTLAKAARVVVTIDSAGGDAAVAFRMARELWDHPASVAVVGRLAGSAACFLLQGARRRLARPGARLLVHAPSTLLAGTARTLAQAARELEADTRKLTVWLALRCRRPVRETWNWLRKGDRVFDAEEALRAGLTDEVTDADPLK